MDEIPEARAIPDAALEGLVAAVEPSWELREATATDRGFCSVYRLVVADGDATRSLYLKASPDGEDWGIPTEARIQAVLDAHTTIPVPTVHGVVDEDDDYPTPAYLMNERPGEALAYEAVCRFDDDTLRRLARETGEHLAELHSVSAVDQFGHVRHDSPTLAGGPPGGDPASLTVGEPRDDWRRYLHEYLDEELERHGESQFSELTPALREWFEAGIESLDGPFDPVLGRNDHGLHNLLVDPETGAITAMLDWGYTLAVPAAFDVEFAVYLYSGAFLAGLPDVEDRRPLVREAMLSGYRATAPERVAAVGTPNPLYEGAAMLRIMNDFEHLTVPEEHEAAVIDRIRADARSLLDR